MDGFVKENLEEYLSGQLSASQLEKFEQRLAGDPAAADELARFEENATLFEELRLPEEELLMPTAGFYARVRQQIEEEEATPFWQVFLEPLLLRRAAVAAFAWVVMMGAAAFYQQGDRGPHMAESILAQPPEVSDYYVRLGSDLDMNRDTMLSAVLVSGR